MQSLNLINLYINLPWSCELRRTKLLVKKLSVFSWFSIKTIFGWIFLFLNFHHFSSGNGDADADAGVVRLSCFVNNCGGNGDAGVVRLSCFVNNGDAGIVRVGSFVDNGSSNGDAGSSGNGDASANSSDWIFLTFCCSALFGHLFWLSAVAII